MEVFLNLENDSILLLDRKGLLYAGQDFLYVQLGTKAAPKNAKK